MLFGFWAVGGFRLLAGMRGPATSFAQTAPPPAPDYSKSVAWLAFSGEDGIERTTYPGVTAVNESEAGADVFFVHPTTVEGNAVWNAPYDAPYDAAPLFTTVLLGQASVFNGCCRIFAPHYRQATLAALKTPAAMTLAFSDIDKAFSYYLDHMNQGRPFIIAGHSQGTAHAIRLIQERILGKVAEERLIAAYLIGGYVPDTFGELGLPICSNSIQTGCVISFNTSQEDRFSSRVIVEDRRYWWRGELETEGRSSAVCVNPLNWSQSKEALASANRGSLPLLRPALADVPTTLPDLVDGLTGAVCRDNMLEVDVPWSAPGGFGDRLSLFTGSYHLNDYGLFYEALRRNAIDRVQEFARGGN